MGLIKEPCSNLNTSSYKQKTLLVIARSETISNPENMRLPRFARNDRKKGVIARE